METLDSNQRQSGKQQNKRKKFEEYDYLTSHATTIKGKSCIENIYKRGKRCEMQWKCVFEFGR